MQADETTVWWSNNRHEARSDIGYPGSDGIDKRRGLQARVVETVRDIHSNKAVDALRCSINVWQSVALYLILPPAEHICIERATHLSAVAARQKYNLCVLED